MNRPIDLNEHLNFRNRETFFFVIEDSSIVEKSRIIEVIYDSTIKLAIKSNQFLGFFKTKEDLELFLKQHGYVNINLIIERKGYFFENLIFSYFDKNRHLVSVLVERLDSEIDERHNPYYNLEKRLNSAVLHAKEKLIKLSTYNVTVNNEPENSYLKIVFNGWVDFEVMNFLIDYSRILVNAATKKYDDKITDYTGLHSLLNAYENKEVLVNKKLVKYFDTSFKHNLKNLGHKFDDFKREQHYYHSYKSDNEYYNDQLDMDQQSAEFWDNI